MFATDTSEAKQIGLKLKQYVDAKFDELRFKGSSTQADAYEEAQLFAQDLSEEIDQLVS